MERGPGRPEHIHGDCCLAAVQAVDRESATPAPAFNPPDPNHGPAVLKATSQGIDCFAPPQELFSSARRPLTGLVELLVGDGRTVVEHACGPPGSRT